MVDGRVRLELVGEHRRSREHHFPALRVEQVPGARAAILDRMLDYGVDATIGYVDAAEELHGQLSGVPGTPSVFIDPLAEGWFVGRPDLIGSDGVHPNDAGHAYLAAKIAPLIRNQLTIPV